MNSMNSFKRKIPFLVGLAVFLLFFSISLMYLQQPSLPKIYNDEFGYWGVAAQFYRLNWSNIISNIPYYSFGYSTVLYFLLRTFGSFSLAYKIAIILNSFWLTSSFLVIQRIEKNLFPNINYGLNATFSLAITILSGGLIQAQYTWPENILLLLNNLLFLFLIRVVKKNHVYDWISLVIIAVFQYYVHQRTLGVLIALLLTLAILSLMRKECRKNFCIFIIILFIGFILGQTVKTIVIDQVWLNTSQSQVNNFSGQISTISYLFSLDGLFSLLSSVAGKLFYFFGSTLFIGPVGVGVVCYELCRNIKEKRWNVDFSFYYFFLLLVFLGTLAINSISMLQPTYITHVVYGRYLDNISGVFILIGLASIAMKEISIREALAIILIYILLSVNISTQCNQFLIQKQLAINNIGIAPFVEEEWIEIKKSIFYYSAIWIVIYAALTYIKTDALKIILLLIVVSINGIIIYSSVQEKFVNRWRDTALSSEEIHDKILTLETEDSSIYALQNMSGRYLSGFSGNAIQFLFPNKQIEYVEKDEIDHLPKDSYLVSDSEEILSDRNKLDELYTSKYFKLYRVN